MRKIFIIVLLTVFSFSTLSTGAAQASGIHVKGSENINVKAYTVEDVLSLEPYVYVENGLFNLDVEAASKAGMDYELISGQQNFFAQLNQQVRAGELTVSEDLSIQNNNQEQVQNELVQNGGITLFSSCIPRGVTTSPESYWWGYKSKLNSCDTLTMIDNSNTVAAGGAGSAIALTGLAVWFPVLLAGSVVTGLTSSWYWLFATRLQANNNGKGVIVEMTWVAAFDITPQ